MFTGIVEELGSVVSLTWQGSHEREERAPASPAIASRRDEAAVLRVRGPLVASDAAPGDSIAVSGVCLTVVSVGDGEFTADVMKETFDRTALGSLAPGEPVNLERAATLTTRLGGHLVQGHVDGVGSILATVPGDSATVVRIALPAGLSRYVVEKGSISVDGISLTVVAVDDAAFAVSLIPTTLERTTLGRKGAGALVNLEVDIVAKHIEKLLSTRE